MDNAFSTLGHVVKKPSPRHALRPEDASALHYRHLGVSLLRQLIQGEPLDKLLVDRARGYTVSRYDPVTGASSALLVPWRCLGLAGEIILLRVHYILITMPRGCWPRTRLLSDHHQKWRDETHFFLQQSAMDPCTTITSGLRFIWLDTPDIEKLSVQRCLVFPTTVLPFQTRREVT